MRRPIFNIILSLSVVVSMAACAPAATALPLTQPPATTAPQQPKVLRLATTTSTADTGLLDAIVPAFESQYGVRVDVVAVGTGQALALGASGDADVVLVHARAQEDKFVANGDGLERRDVMYNDFVIVGPAADPAGIAGTELAKDAFAKIAAKQAVFVSRGDKSGTNTKEMALWAAAGLTPTVDSPWYLSIGQGMGETLTFTNEKPGYTLTDRGTWLAQQANLRDLKLLVGGPNVAGNPDKSLLNPYGVIPVNPAKHPGVNFDLATDFANWITSVETQQLISAFGQDKFGQPLFYASSDAWKAAHP
jgi:tungstate transport system substrate-binding protein